jgi:microtubule-associated protein-like 6
VCRFSPDVSHIAFGHHGYGTKLEVVTFDSATGKITSKKPSTEKMSSALNHLDWSLDGKTILTADTSYEVRAFNVDDGKVQKNGYLSNFKETEWKTQSLNLGWPVQGIYGKCPDLTEINCVERSHNGQIIATGWDTGEVKFHNWPCLKPEAKSDSYYGHSSHLTKVMFTAKDDFLITTGGNDMTVFVWDTDIAGLEDEEIADPDDLRPKVDRARQNKARKAQGNHEEQKEFGFDVEEAG